MNNKSLMLLTILSLIISIRTTNQSSKLHAKDFTHLQGQKISTLKLRTPENLNNRNQPLFLIAHMVNNPQDIISVLKQGYNAMQIDVRCDLKQNQKCDQNTVRVAHDQSQQGVLFRYWIKTVQQKDSEKLFSKLALMMFDIKTQTPGIAQTLKKIMSNHSISSNVPRTYSIDQIWKAHTIFSHQFQDNLYQYETIDISGFITDFDGTSQEVASYYLNHNFYRGWYGKGVSSKLKAINFYDQDLQQAIKIRQNKVGITGIYSWTWNKPEDVITQYNLGIDGVLVQYYLNDSQNKSENNLNSNRYMALLNQNNIKLATRQDFLNIQKLTNIVSIQSVRIKCVSDGAYMRGDDGQWVNQPIGFTSQKNEATIFKKIQFKDKQQGKIHYVFLVEPSSHIDTDLGLFLDQNNWWWFGRAKLWDEYDEAVWSLVDWQNGQYSFLNEYHQQYLYRFWGSAYVNKWGQGKINSGQGRWTFEKVVKS